ncbi:MAG: phosphoglucomutase/phosphomannomutase family protein [Candidatus Omnitrophica bacterium]|nr:phosphoglucomutase/phosphomannomutase family protein [Candidatus Omnitrophota bacterium]
MQNKQIRFGTDGFRGIIADNYTFDNLRILTQATADYLGEAKTVALGYDTRFMSKEFAELVAEILASNRITVLLSDRIIPTPCLSFTVKQKRLDLGIMITASHNPYQYNGFKIKLSTGGAAPAEVTERIEALLGKHPIKQDPQEAGKRIIRKDFLSDYIRFIRDYIDLKRIRNKRFRVLVDVMYGAGDGIIAQILKGTVIKLEFIHNQINPAFGEIRPEPIEENLKELKTKLKKERFDIGIALDGDGDRIAAVAPGGIFIHPQKILGLLALHLAEDKGFSGGIVKTICGSTLIDHIAQALNVKLYETPVGFKYISNLMQSQDILVGGEEAGGMGVKGYIPERDGIMAGLLLIEMMVYRNKDILKIVNEMEKRFGRYYYLRQDLSLDRPIELKKDNLPQELLGKKVIQVKDYDGLKLICEDESWLMFRVSGTEPMVRLYSEAKSIKKARQLLSLGKMILDSWL